jgi:hypothetical protein
MTLIIDSLCGKFQVCDDMSSLLQIKTEIINLCTQKRQIFKEQCYRVRCNAASSVDSLRGSLEGQRGRLVIFRK